MLGQEALFEQQWKWESEGTDTVNIAINIAPEHFQHPCILNKTKLLLEEFPISSYKITYEITERDEINLKEWDSSVREIEKTGVLVSIDDFGTGYNNLAHLITGPFDFVKVDRSFISTVIKQKNNQNIIRAILFLSENIGFKAIAEGVETKQQLDRLTELGVEIVQGFYFDAALPARCFMISI